MRYVMNAVGGVGGQSIYPLGILEIIKKGKIKPNINTQN
jgi:hypothetical protein